MPPLQVYLAAGTVYGLEGQLSELEDAARCIHSGTDETELADLEDQVATAAAQVHHAEIQVRTLLSAPKEGVPHLPQESSLSLCVCLFLPSPADFMDMVLPGCHQILLFKVQPSLEKEMATHSSILAWKSPWTERSLVGCSPWDYMTEHVCTRVEGDGLVAIKW